LKFSICLEQEFLDYVRSCEDSSGKDEVKLSSVTPARKRRKPTTTCRRGKSSVETPVKILCQSNEGISEESSRLPDDQNNSNSSPIKVADSFQENNNDEVTNNVSFDFETTNEYNPEQYQEEEENSSNLAEKKFVEISCTPTINYEVEKGDSISDSTEFPTAIVKAEIVAENDFSDIDEINLGNIEGWQEESIQVNVKEEYHYNNNDGDSVEDTRKFYVDFW